MEPKDYEKLLDDYQFCWRRIYRYFETFKGSDVRFGQGRLLACLVENDGLTQKQIASIMNISGPSLTELIGKCEKKGFIVKEKSEKDKRVSQIKITPEGTKALALRQCAKTATSTDIFSMLNEADAAKLAEIVGKLKTKIIEKDMTK